MKAEEHGSVAYIGNSTQTYLNFSILEATGNDNPFNGFDPEEKGLFDAMMDPQFQTIGEILNEARKSCERANNMTEILITRHIHALTLLGDPSLLPQFGYPQEQDVSYTLVEGAAPLFITVTDPYAYVALTDDNGSLLAAGKADQDGNALFNLEPLESDLLQLTVTAKNRIPYFATIQITDVGSDEIVPIGMKLQCYPNPFNPITTISFELTTESNENTESLELVIYNIKGQRIVSSALPFDSAQGDKKKEYSIIWNGTDDDNQPVPSGIYLVQVRSGRRSASCKIALIK